MTDDPGIKAGREHSDVACLGCPLVCDDLVLRITPDGIDATGNACDRARGVYASLPRATGEEARIGTETTPREAALERAASILDQAHLPLITGLDTDVDGVRAALRVAERCGGVFDHVHGDALSLNLRVMQTEGWLATTLGEARNRADLLLIFGTSPVAEFPRLLERLTGTEETLFEVGGRRRLFLLGPHEEPLPRALGQCDPHMLRADRARLGGIAGLLRAQLAGTNPPPRGPEDLCHEALEELLAGLRAARYPVLIWAAGEFDGGHGDLTVQRFAELCRQVGEQTRCTALTLAPSSGAATVQHVSTWYCGFPNRVSFAGAALDYDPHRYSARRLLAREEADALLWVGGVDDGALPATHPMPRVVLAHTPPPPLPGDVYIRVGVPGLDHAGQMFRCDGVPLHLRKLRDAASPSVGQVLDEIRERCP